MLSDKLAEINLGDAPLVGVEGSDGGSLLWLLVPQRTCRINSAFMKSDFM